MTLSIYHLQITLNIWLSVVQGYLWSLDRSLRYLLSRFKTYRIRALDADGHAAYVIDSPSCGTFIQSSNDSSSSSIVRLQKKITETLKMPSITETCQEYCRVILFSKMSELEKTFHKDSKPQPYHCQILGIRIHITKPWGVSMKNASSLIDIIRIHCILKETKPGISGVKIPTIYSHGNSLATYRLNY